MAQDNNVHESCGCACVKGVVTLLEVVGGIKINADFHAILEPHHARFLARKLYRLARKIERRAQAETAVASGQAPGALIF